MLLSELLKGVNAYGVRTPLIQIGDDLKKIVFDSVMERTGGNLPSKSIIMCSRLWKSCLQISFPGEA